MNAWRTIWNGLRGLLRKKRVFAIDAESFESLRLVALHQNRSPREVASNLFKKAALEQDAQSRVMQCWDQLSPRQRQVAAYIWRGDSTRQISAHLNIAPTTVKSHVECILYKFGINSRVALRELLSPWDLSDYL